MPKKLKRKYVWKKQTEFPNFILQEKYISIISYEKFANQNTSSFFFTWRDLDYYCNYISPHKLNLNNLKLFKKIFKSIKLWNPLIEQKLFFLNNLFFFRSMISFFNFFSSKKKIIFKNKWGWRKSYLKLKLNLRISGGDYYYYKFGIFSFINKYFVPTWKRSTPKEEHFFLKIIFPSYAHSSFFVSSSIFVRKKFWKNYWSMRKVRFLRILKNIKYFSESNNFADKKKICVKKSVLHFLYSDYFNIETSIHINDSSTNIEFDITEKIRLLTRDHSNNFGSAVLNILFLFLIEHYFTIIKLKNLSKDFWINFFFLIYVLILSKFNMNWKTKRFLGQKLLSLSNLIILYKSTVISVRPFFLKKKKNLFLWNWLIYKMIF